MWLPLLTLISLKAENQPLPSSFIPLVLPFPSPSPSSFSSSFSPYTHTHTHTHTYTHTHIHTHTHIYIYMICIVESQKILIDYLNDTFRIYAAQNVTKPKYWGTVCWVVASWETSRVSWKICWSSLEKQGPESNKHSDQAITTDNCNI